MKTVPTNFKKMDLILTYDLQQRAERIKVLAIVNVILYYLVRDYHIFYSQVDKFGNGNYTEFHFYCRPQDETSIAYRLGCYNQCLFQFYDKSYFKNPIHTVPGRFPDSICIPAKYDENHNLIVGIDDVYIYEMGQKLKTSPK